MCVCVHVCESIHIFAEFLFVRKRRVSDSRCEYTFVLERNKKTTQMKYKFERNT